MVGNSLNCPSLNLEPFGMASCIFSNLSQWMLSIPETHTSNSVIYYDILIRVGSVSWSVSRRYNEFAELNSTLVKEQGLDKDLLPPKKFIGNLNPDFVDQRRQRLEIYLNTVFQHLVRTMPPELVAFLDLESHDVMFIIRKIPQKLATSCSKRCSELSILQVHSLSVRLKLPCPPAEMSGYQHDFCSILEACSRVSALRVEGCDNIYSSVDNPPTMDFIPFKTLRKLILNNVTPDLITNADVLRSTLCRLSWVSSGLATIEDALLCDSIHKTLSEHKVWFLKKADFSNNSLKTIGDAASLMPNLVELDLSSNQISSLQGLHRLEKLEKLSLKNNGLTSFDKLQLEHRLNSLTSLSLSDNKISSLKGLDVLTNLGFLDVSNNIIAQLDDIALISALHRLSSLILQGNPITTIFDYRVKVLELFNDRVNYVSLDHELPGERELDKVRVLQALRIARKGKPPF